MSKVERPEKTIQFDPDKCSEMYEELVEVFKKYHPTVGEILIAYGNLGYTLGASIGGYKDKGPGPEELQTLYYTMQQEPLSKQISFALMGTGFQVLEWYDEWAQKLLKQSQDNGEE